MKTFYKEMKKIGNRSLGVIFPKEIVDLESLKPGKMIKVTINDPSSEIQQYRCEKCDFEFPDYLIRPFCPRCSNDKLEVVGI